MPVEEQTQNTDDMYAALPGPYRAGPRMTIANRIISDLSFLLSKLGSPSGNVTFIIRRTSDDSILVSKVWGNASALLPIGSEEWKIVTFDAPVFVDEEVRLLWEFVQGASTDHQVSYRITKSDVKADEFLSFYRDGGWTDIESWDGTYKYTYEAPAPGLENKSANMAAKMVGAGLI